MPDKVRVIYYLEGGKMTQVWKPAGRIDRPNFVIQSCNCGPHEEEYGDWSGFRTLLECAKQFPELEQLAKQAYRDDGYYRVVER